MKARNEFFVYTILILLAGGLSLLLVTDILQAKAERAKFSAPDEEIIPKGSETSTEPTPLQTAVAVFNDRPDMFGVLVNPLPTATQPILPTPTETPIPLVNETWKLINIVGGKFVQLQTVEGKFTYKEGDPIPKKSPGSAIYKLVKIDKANGRIFLWRTTDNVMGWFSKDGGVEYAKELPK